MGVELRPNLEHGIIARNDVRPAQPSVTADEPDCQPAGNPGEVACRHKSRLGEAENQKNPESAGEDQFAFPKGLNRERFRRGDEPCEAAEQYW